MTLGQRIAQKRKELGLSQEGLGEQLGVSRQAIYKWESDASLPEIEKLITLSKIFSVSVGWLLGVEEDAPPIQQADGSRELTEEQLIMVQEIVDRYLAAQPKPVPPKRRRLVRICTAVAVVALVVALFNLFSRLEQFNQDFSALYNSVNNVNGSVNSQINSITRRVENILKSQNNLMAEWSAQVASTDLKANTVTFDIRVVPRTYVEGMTAVFVARSGEETAEAAVEPGADHTFTGQVICPLSDKIDVTAVLVTGEKRETQWLDDFDGLYSNTFPDLSLDSWLMDDVREGVLLAQLPADQAASWGSRGVRIRNTEDQSRYFLGWNPEPPETVRVGLFQDHKLLTWYQGSVETTNLDGVPTEDYVWRRPEAVTLEAGHTYHEAAVYTDGLGRQHVYANTGMTADLNQEGGIYVNYEIVYVDQPASAAWEF